MLASQPKKPKKPKTDRPLTDTQREMAAQIAAGAESVQQLQRELATLSRRVDRRPSTLTPAERDMSLRALDDHWAQQRRLSRQGDKPDRPLTDEERQLSRPELQRRLSAIRNEAWADRQRLMGRETVSCEVCGRQKTPGDPGHFCARAPWQGPLQYRAGLPTHQELVVTGSPTGFNVQRRTTIDRQELAKGYEALQRMHGQYPDQFQQPWQQQPPQPPAVKQSQSPARVAPVQQPRPAPEPSPSPPARPRQASPAQMPTIPISLEITAHNGGGGGSGSSKKSRKRASSSGGDESEREESK